MDPRLTKAPGYLPGLGSCRIGNARHICSILPLVSKNQRMSCPLLALNTLGMYIFFHLQSVEVLVSLDSAPKAKATNIVGGLRSEGKRKDAAEVTLSPAPALRQTMCKNARQAQPVEQALEPMHNI